MTAADRSWTAAGLTPDAYRALTETIPPSRLWSLLLDVFEERAAHRPLSDLTGQWRSDGFVAPCPVDQRTLVALDAHLLAAAADFDAIELSPLAPLGACSTVGLASQNKVLSALRGTEVVADPTNVLALECAARLRADPSATIRLATSHRCVRAQALPAQSGFARHFRMFCLAAAAREQQDHGFLVDAVVEQIETMRRALDRLEQHGYAFPARRIEVLASPEWAAVGDRIAARVRGPDVRRSVLEHRYYHGIRFRIDAPRAPGELVPLIDGGAFDWVGRLASNRRLTFVASGMGSQLVALLYRNAREGPAQRAT